MSDDDRPPIAPGYPLGELARALTTRETHGDAATRARAETRIARWMGVLRGMLGGKTTVGSRTPLADVPAWVTLEVAKGGFATGALLAGGPLAPDEHERLAALGRSDESRAALNAWFVSDAGLAELGALLRSGCYRIDVPEHGALLAVAWLAENGKVERAREVLDALVPFFDRLRFYPLPSAVPLTPRPVVTLRTVGEVAEDLAAVKTPRQVARMNTAVTVWAPLADRAVALFLETVEGPAPSLATDESGAPRRRPGGGWVIEGGWPCRHHPAGWAARARALLDEDAQAAAVHGRFRTRDAPRENYARLRELLGRCAADPASLTGRDVGMIRKILATVHWKRGLPGSARATTLRATQAAAAARPTSPELAAVVRARLATLAPGGGLADLAAVTGPVRDDEAAPGPTAARLAGAAIPPHLVHKLVRCLEGTVEELVAARVITSSEVLARLLPQLTAQVAAGAFVDPAARLLYGALYAAFRRRRSLLLVDLQHQVALDELPWLSAIVRFAGRGVDARAQSRGALEQLVTLALASFPHVILPNKLLQEIEALAKGAGLALPLVEEIAVDIFMGSFTAKYLEAAKVAARVLAGTLYARYYDLPIARVRALDDLVKRGRGASTSPGFDLLCAERAGPARPQVRFTVHNGTIVEQEQILTTHNLAVLVDALGIDALLPVAELARACFRWICQELQRNERSPWHAQLLAIKNSAYAWRQMLFFLSLAPLGEQAAFVGWSRAHLGEQRGAIVRERLARAARGLWHVLGGGSFDADGRAATPEGDAIRFLGWTHDRHFLQEPPTGE